MSAKHTQSEVLRLAEMYADAVATHRLESRYGTSRGYTLEKAKERDEAHSALDAELRRLHEANQELLETLRRIEGVAMANESRDLPGIVQTARAAIAKAEGQQ